MTCNAHYQNTFVYIKLIYFHNRCHRAFQIFECRLAFRVHKHLIFLLSSGRNGAKDSASASIYLSKLWINPKYFLRCDSLRGILSVLTGFVFRINGVTPVEVILCPSHSHVFFPNVQFVNFSAIFSLPIFFCFFNC